MSNVLYYHIFTVYTACSNLKTFLSYYGDLFDFMTNDVYFCPQH